jgi:Response regulator containing a CheY-like receiver domain and an HTH DNA-binding domain
VGARKDTLQDADARIAAAFERAPFEERGWDSALRILAEATGSAHGQLLAMGGPHLAFNWVSDVDEGFHRALDDIDGYSPHVNYRIAAARRPMELAWEHHYDAVRKIQPGEAYVAAIKKLGMENGVQTVLAQQPGAFFGLAVLRSETDGRSTEMQRQVFASAARHVLAAIRVQNAIEHQGALMVQGSMEAMRSPAILLDATARVCFVTETASALLGPGTIQVRNSALRATRPEIDRQLQVKIGQALAGAAMGAADMWIRGPAGLVLIDVRALPAQPWHFGFSPRVIITIRSPMADATMSASEAADLVERQAGHLSAALGLTDAEARVVALLARGMSRRDAAAMRGVSAQTVTSQLRTIFLKCNVRREAELVALARGVMDVTR